MHSRIPLLLVSALAFQSLAAPPDGQRSAAQTAVEESSNRVVVVENVRLDYAQVLNVSPVYQTLRASRTEERCDERPVVAPSTAIAEVEDEGRFSRMIETVRGFFSNRPAEQEPVPTPPTSTRRNCRVVEVPREFRRPIAYDVDYVYKGIKYRSRLPDDPGNRLRIRVSVTPYIPNSVMAPAR